MRSIWLVFVIVLATGHLGEKLLVSSQTPDEPSGLDDMYLEGQSSGGVPSDDEDGEDNFSGSGSDELRPTDILEEANTTKWLHTFTLESTSSPTTMQTETEVTGLETSEDNGLAETLQPGSTDNVQTTADVSLEDTVLPDTGVGVLLEASPGDRTLDSPKEVTSEDMLQRTDVLAAVIACGVVGFLCAVFLVLLLAYRMKKKDEGSYSLGVAKQPPNTDQKLPAQEFYA